MEYIIAMNKNDNNLIIPSDLFLYYNLNVIFIFEKKNQKLLFILWLMFIKINIFNVWNFLILKK